MCVSLIACAKAHQIDIFSFIKKWSNLLVSKSFRKVATVNFFLEFIKIWLKQWLPKIREIHKTQKNAKIKSQNDNETARMLVKTYQKAQTEPYMHTKSIVWSIIDSIEISCMKNVKNKTGT